MPALMHSKNVQYWSDKVPVERFEAVEGITTRFVPDPKGSLVEVRIVAGPERLVPEQLIEQYVATALRRVLVEVTEEGRYFLTVPILGDVWAEGLTEEGALAELGDVVRQWVLMKIEDHDRDLPVLGTLNLNRL